MSMCFAYVGFVLPIVGTTGMAGSSAIIHACTVQAWTTFVLFLIVAETLMDGVIACVLALLFRLMFSWVVGPVIASCASCVHTLCFLMHVQRSGSFASATRSETRTLARDGILIGVSGFIVVMYALQPRMFQGFLATVLGVVVMVALFRLVRAIAIGATPAIIGVSLVTAGVGWASAPDVTVLPMLVTAAHLLLLGQFIQSIARACKEQDVAVQGLAVVETFAVSGATWFTGTRLGPFMPLFSVVSVAEAVSALVVFSCGVRVAVLQTRRRSPLLSTQTVSL